MEEKVKKYDFDRVVRLVLSCLSIGVGIYIINYLSPVLLPFVVGFILAYILDPVVNFFQKKLHVHNRMISVILTLLLVVGLIWLALWLLIPYLIDEVSDMAKMLTAYAKSSLNVPFVPAAIHDYVRQYVDVEQLYSLLSKEQWMKLINQVATGTWSFVGGTLSVILNIASWLIVLLYMFFVMLDFDKLSKAFKGAIPQKYRRTSFKVLGDVQHTMSRYFRGQALVSFFVGVIFAIEFYIIGLPMAIVFGLLIGVLNMVPYLQLISIPVAAFLCLVASVATGGSFWVLFGWTFAAYCICQVIQDMILIPAIMKSAMGLNPAIVFLSLSLWAYVLGFIGLIIALPLTTLIISYYCEYVLHIPYDPTGNKKKKKDKKSKKKNGLLATVAATAGEDAPSAQVDR
ncbi:MAG: AI-2E family transporter [Muribaculaceae bacterium]|nr:AI-2E family transporter [Muribaculaceae bacterium]